jgi:poly(A) polymerase
MFDGRPSGGELDVRTSLEIYRRIRWDARLDPSRFVLVIDVRSDEPKRLSLTAFVPGGDIPRHRGIRIEADGEVLWARATGVDRLDQSHTGRVCAPQRLRAFLFAPRPVSRWDPSRHAWTSTGPAPADALPTLRARITVVTWNALCDRYHADRCESTRSIARTRT